MSETKTPADNLGNAFLSDDDGPIVGQISPGALPSALRRLYVGRRTGLLHCVRGDERLSIRFIRGHIVHGSASGEYSHLGPTMVRLGLLSPEDFAQVQDRMEATHERLGALLKEMGVIDQSHLEDAIALHVRELLLAVFSWDEGRYAFEPEQTLTVPADDITLKMSTGEMILEVVRGLHNPADVKRTLGDLNRILVLSRDPLLRFQRITLSAADGFVLSRIDGTMSAREVANVTPLPEQDVLRSLLGLLCTGIIELEDVPSPARFEAAPVSAATVAHDALREEVGKIHGELWSKTDHELLHLAEGADEPAIRAAFAQLARKFHPDRHHDPALADLRDKLHAVFARITKAQQNLIERVRRPPAAVAIPIAKVEVGPPVDASPEQAARAVEEAAARLNEGKHWEAVGILETALPDLQGKLRRRAQLLLGKAFLKSPDRIKEAEGLLQDVVKEEPDNVEAFSMLGALYKQRGLNQRATAMFRRVLDLKPGAKQAERELLALAEAPPTGEGRPGLLGRLLRRK